MFDNSDTSKLCAALVGREYGIVSLIVEITELLEECDGLSLQLGASRTIKVTADELIMLREFRSEKIERARQELTEIRQLKESLLPSINIDNKWRLKHE